MGRLTGVMAAAGATAAILAGTAFAHASQTAAEDGADSFNVASGTSVTITSAKVVISVPSTSPSMKITCTTSRLAGMTGSSLKFNLGLPIFSNASGAPCGDTLGFTDRFQSNSTNGMWSIQEKDFTNSGAGDEGLAEPNASGDKLVISLPKGGLVDTNNWPCSIIFAPTKAASISGAYNDAGTFTIKNAKIPVSVSGPAFCGPASQTVTLTATYTVSPGFFDQG
jgi:hypothetical protein